MRASALFRDGRVTPAVWAAAAVGVLASSVFALTCARTVTLVDSGELIVACATGGVAHPPGFPVYTMLGNLFSRLPIGSVAHRLSLMSAFFAAVATVLVTLIAGELGATGRCAASRTSWRSGRWWLEGFMPAFATGATLSFTTTFWAYAAVAEVYTLNLALIAAVLWLLLRWRRVRTDRLVVAAGGVYGLALGVHHATVVLVAPALLVLAWRIAGARVVLGRAAVKAACATAAGLLCYLYLPIAASRAPVLNWGDPSSWQRFVWHVTARQYQVNLFSRDIDQVWTNLAALISTLPNELTVGGLAVAAVGFTWLWRRDRDVVWVVTAISVLGVAYAVNYEIAEDTEAYGLTTILALVISIGGGLRWLAERSRGSRAWTFAAVAVAAWLPAANLVAHWQACDRSHDRVARRFVEDALGGVGRNGLLLTMDWQLYAPYLYLRHIEGFRTDATVIDVNLVRRSWYVDQYLRMVSPHTMAACEPQADAFLLRLREWEHGRPHSPEELTRLFTSLLNAFVGVHLPGREAHLTPPMEPGVATGLAWTPHGLTVKLSTRAPEALQPTPFVRVDHLRGDPRRLSTVARAKVRPYYASMLTSQGSYLTMVGQLEAARGLLTLALDLEPGSSQAHQVLGELEMTAGDLEAARRCFAAAVRLDGDNVRARRRLVEVQGLLQRPGTRTAP